MRRITESAKRAIERREAENEAQRLSDAVPELKSLKLRINEKPLDAAQDVDISHIRHIQVQNAPAMFDLPCCDRHCTGHHDLTTEILEALRTGETSFTGSDVCGGSVKESDCQLELHFEAEASYATAAAAAAS